MSEPDSGSADPAADFEALLASYADEIRRCRYGTFRGVIRDGRIVVFAIEQEWRPHLEEERKATRKKNVEVATGMS